jgi:type IV pilus assembly protein PilV
VSVGVPIINQRGTSLIEVLVAILILAFGLLGLAGLQSRLQVSDMESYQRAQALVLLNDMASRITSNRAAAAQYVTAAPLGAGAICPTVVATRADIDATQWCNALQGAAAMAGGAQAGAMIGARGCVEALPDNEYLVTAAWQGIAPISAPPASVTCGAGEYDGTGDSNCVDDLCRRVVATIVRIGTL